VLQVALLAFLGGLILNLMPCVFPVLSIKVLSLVRHSGHSPGAVRLHGLAYTLGVVATFVALAGVLVALRAAGAEIGWGFQLQSPVVVAGLAFLLFAMGLSLSGVVEFGTSLAAVGGRFGSGNGYGGSSARACSRRWWRPPARRLSWEARSATPLRRPPVWRSQVFVALGLGMAAPFLALTFAPRLLALLPRPGGWMETLKQILAFPIYATVAWLVFVLAQQVGPTALFAALLGMVVVAFGLWAWRFTGPLTRARAGSRSGPHWRRSPHLSALGPSSPATRVSRPFRRASPTPRLARNPSRRHGSMRLPPRAGPPS
jgi:thiol:disulfide interchange protein DsbD